MRQLIDSVADATAHRDRDDLDAAIARLLFDYLDPVRVAVYRLIEDGCEHQRVQRRITLQRGLPEAPPEQTRVSDLPRLSDIGPWYECILLRDTVHYVPGDGGLPGGVPLDEAVGLSEDEDAAEQVPICSVFPLVGERDVIGLLELEVAGRPRRLLPRDARLVNGILRVMRNHVAVLDYGERDMLTGLFNRKTFDSSFGKLRARVRPLGRSLDNEEPSWLGVVDIDRFKSINDRFGHLYGDEVLLLIARLMRECYRGADQMYRFGGEEFVIVLDRANAEGAALAFDRFRRTVEAYDFPQVGRVTVSVGYTKIEPMDAPASAFERADAALYHSKHTGRNQTLCYELLVAAGHLAAKEERGDDVLLF